MAVKVFTIDRDYYSHNREIYDWCAARFQNGQWSSHNFFGYMTYKFKNPDDHALFALTWSCYSYSTN